MLCAIAKIDLAVLREDAAVMGEAEAVHAAAIKKEAHADLNNLPIHMRKSF